ncbi:Pyruvate/2-oxoglutarate dehydrogenase complex, dihydrolipoamide acyltransferase (E2) component (plasmid) [Phaeobacter inhibens]|uniref:Pyruvate/2-oxoglutarate dehydrogenase complex, dihydrolipoamide acyltransferase (E2) component n=1 Tax=Phaeobacter inhibens TaxID=221822 RepID=A0ABM6RL95_9RHOB|nr:biotin/lipoyl-containing protein [Phaeobacter inhibens]AUQ52677.1 Pyruvate/2-oxoglutarate dehydrogenase complex, dihydrolipoamide acyltransferase (E2) component [Phaeobacter inhibens]AUQ56878.1 Pyruvate/2-oxoglutarate dehydrogenase complex, dihydrolipoamide acyltransferase (E2) component [Phaeobacter inhibens]AUQ68858.1 Pyruvate/2-oxoglutarate dehydrogenase complex, dihydrolipoamide acyltransferase (E2) component [Phaeobacter inhibens]AUQ80895.1 Pyruvate/2-oxoglutarate dehydrogenase complex,
MPHEVIMPALGMAQDTGKIVSWLKSAGDPVRAGDALFEVETDKATMEVESPADGYLTDVQAEAGADVPVGNVIALVSETAENSGAKAPVDTCKDDAALPEGKAVIMPALGMAQDTGVIVAWHKGLGDAVAAEDILFEVETDKATMEVEAGADGFVAALLAEATEAAPVGDTIAIISAEKPANPVQRSIADNGAAKPIAAPDPAPKPKDESKPAPEKASKRQAVKSPDGRILASPKARRLALEQGLDLNRLVEAGCPQPFHVADIETLSAMPAETAGHATTSSRRLTADLPTDGFGAFAAWFAENTDLKDANALLAGLAAASLGRDTATIAVESFGQSRAYRVPAGPFSAITRAEDDSAHDLILRDLRLSRISSVDLGAEDAPVFTLTQASSGLSITLECAGEHLSAGEAVNLLSEFAGRMEQPLRHLL